MLRSGIERKNHEQSVQTDFKSSWKHFITYRPATDVSTTGLHTKVMFLVFPCLLNYFGEYSVIITNRNFTSNMT